MDLSLCKQTFSGILTLILQKLQGLEFTQSRVKSYYVLFILRNILLDMIIIIIIIMDVQSTILFLFILSINYRQNEI